MGNVRSLTNAFEYLGQDVVVTDDAKVMDASERIVLPGVGAFGDAMKAIHQRKVVEPLQRQVFEFKKPLLGICLGMQLLAKESVEHGHNEGLGWINAHIKPLTPSPGLKVPHVGWNSLEFPANERLFHGLKHNEANFYFVHSFHMICAERENLLATAVYGQKVAAVVRKGNIVATQFHPEKSQDNGLLFLKNWIN